MNDLISRKATLEAIQRHFNPTGEEMPTGVAAVLVGVGVVISTLPSTDRKGHWIQKDYYDADWNVYECDQCGEPWQLEAGTPKDNNMNFCPRCGADMRGEQDD